MRKPLLRAGPWDPVLDSLGGPPGFPGFCFQQPAATVKIPRYCIVSVLRLHAETENQHELKIAQVLVWLGPSFGKTCVDGINTLKTKPHWKKKISKEKQSQRPLIKYDVSRQWSGHITPAGSSEGCRRARHPLQSCLNLICFHRARS